MNSFDLMNENARLYVHILRHNWPPVVFVTGHLVPELFRMTLYVLMGSMLGGDAGRNFALIGCSVFAVQRATVSEVSDVPICDAQAGTLPTLMGSGHNLLAHYAARAIPLAALACADFVVLLIALSAIFGTIANVLPILSSAWIVAPTIVGGLAFGLVVVTPAIGNELQNLLHNAAAALLTVTSGAVFAPQLLPPFINWIAVLLPFRHAITALRQRLNGEPFIVEFALEVAVAALWIAVAAGLYAGIQRRYLSGGRGLA